jgi:hypothetical protein
LYWEGVRVSQEIETGELICKETGLRNWDSTQISVFLDGRDKL